MCEAVDVQGAPWRLRFDIACVCHVTCVHVGDMEVFRVLDVRHSNARQSCRRPGNERVVYIYLLHALHVLAPTHMQVVSRMCSTPTTPFFHPPPA